MPPLLIAYPAIDPVLVNLGPLPIRWYALGYIGALLFGWIGARALTARDHLWGGRAHASILSIDDLVVYMAGGIILGGRIGYILFYNLPYYLANPLEVLVVWKGGMAFHGGLLGSVIAMSLFARRQKLPVLSVSDLVSPVVPIGIVLVRVANFVKPELWGRPTDVPWAMIFPGSDGQPRHPSQLYEAGLEGVVLLILLALAVRLGGLKREGLITGLFCAGYGVARIASEFFREPDPQLGFLFGGATMGMLLSVPLILFGLFLLIRAIRRPLVVAATA
ncbi:MAG: prolipoprotein diacylglyceryl transferase [Beijerinckiaceae bacterium]|nr:prolipoprotein diacylglyceryl transferase [Beijerinckiaceae bacterium]